MTEGKIVLHHVTTLIHSSVIDFPDDDWHKADFDAAVVEFDRAIAPLLPPDWHIELILFFAPANHTGITCKQQTLPADRAYRFTVLLPVPSQEQAAYGLPRQHFVANQGTDSDFARRLQDAYFCKNVDFAQYDSLSALFFDCIVHSLQRLMQKGIRINGRLTPVTPQPDTAAAART